ncbi:hypothetical protein D3C71_1388000 [compost metagenome]
MRCAGAALTNAQQATEAKLCHLLFIQHLLAHMSKGQLRDGRHEALRIENIGRLIHQLTSDDHALGMQIGPVAQRLRCCIMAG